MRFIGAPRQPEIDQYTIKFLVGAIALGLPIVESLLTGLTGDPITSISASFWATGLWPRNIFVGCLFAVAAFLLAYNGLSETEMWLAKVASLCALGVAMFPCGCDGVGKEIVPECTCSRQRSCSWCSDGSASSSCAEPGQRGIARRAGARASTC
jgi:hypothetical protein